MKENCRECEFFDNSSEEVPWCQKMMPTLHINGFKCTEFKQKDKNDFRNIESGISSKESED